ncbi:MAG TPA: Crp/Fnr family transcriptional regulator [Cyclobacteriaceae bacterium]|nr:Crp/Fnr family transcriptional regulator [Cyclobacteriaceae bacterium]
MYEQLIKNIQNKVNLPREAAELIKNFFTPKKIRKRQYLLNAGDVCRYITFVEKGMLRSFSVDEDGHDHVMQFATEGWWISDMNSFFSGDAAVYNIEALEDSELLQLSKQAMEEMMNQVSIMERYFRLLMQNNIVSLQRRIIASVAYSAEEKYLKLMEICPDIINRAPQQYIASYLGITPETLSRIRKQVSTRK